MKTSKLHVTVPEDVAEALKSRVNKRKRSAFVSAAVLEKLQALEQEELGQALREGYQARRKEDAEINNDWWPVG